MFRERRYLQTENVQPETLSLRSNKTEHPGPCRGGSGGKLTTVSKSQKETDLNSVGERTF